MYSYQGRWASSRREWAFHYGSPATNIEGPGSAWAFVLSGMVFAARLTRSNFSTFAYELGELGSQCAGNGFS